MLFKNVFFILAALTWAESAKILGIFPNPGMSHYILAAKLMKGLAEAGHDVTMITPYEMKKPPKNGTYTEIVLDNVLSEKEMTANLFQTDSKKSPLETFKMVVAMTLGMVNSTFTNSGVKKLLQSNEKFDAVITEQLMNDGLKVFSYIYNCLLIILSSMGPNAWVNPLVGNPQPVSYVPHLFNTNFSSESLIDRAKNLLIYLLDYLVIKYYIHPKHETLMHQVVPDAPPLYDLYTNVSLILLNSHVSTLKSVPVVPNMVEIGGYFIDPPEKLPQDLQEFLDSAKDGVIYFSMGSNLKSKDMPEAKKKIILNVFGKLKQKVLWKFEEDLPEKPSNIMIRKWLPQQDILAHPNIKLFITHGGLLSTTETIYHGVPILALPVFADQPINADKAVEGGYGLKLEYNDPNFTEERLSTLLNEVLENPQYKENAQRRSKLFHDRPQTPMKNAVYWVEYVIRHKGAPHLRVAGIRMPWYKYFMVDVIAVLVLSPFVIFYTLKLLFRKLFHENKHSSQKKIKTN